MEIPAKIQIKHLGNLERIHRQNLKFIDQADVRGVWILRAPGVGPPPQDLGFWAKPNGFGVWGGVGREARF